MMNVIHYCGSFSKLSETFIYDLIVELEQTGTKNTIITNHIVNQDNRPFTPVIMLRPCFKDQIVSVFKKTMSTLGVYEYSHKEEITRARVKSMTNILRKEQPDLVHAHFGTQGYNILSSVIEMNVPLIVSFHGYDAFRLPNEGDWPERFKALFAYASAIIVVSKVMELQLVSLGCPKEKVHIVHVGKKVNAYNMGALVKQPIQKFISIGRLMGKKGFLDCIAAFKLLSPKYPNLTLQIIGKGPLLEALEIFSKEFPNPIKISFLGAVSHSSTKKYLEAADAFILCSKTELNGDKEGIPVVLMEAQAMGLPCVTTMHSGISEVIPEESWWLLAEEGNINSIAGKIEALINAPQSEIEKVKVNGRRKIEEEFNLEIETTKLLGIYKLILNER
jgi:colanic acid/amylovoran biosynthesis glycosyltransferase